MFHRFSEDLRFLLCSCNWLCYRKRFPRWCAHHSSIRKCDRHGETTRTACQTGIWELCS